MPPSYIRVRAVVWAYGHGQTDTQARVTTIHFASTTTHAKCNETCSRIDSSESNRTPRFRTQLVDLITLRHTVMTLLFSERRRSGDVEPNHSNSVLSAFSWSLFAAHQSATSATQNVSPSHQHHVVGHCNSSHIVGKQMMMQITAVKD